jgi:hypothetical protein
MTLLGYTDTEKVYKLNRFVLSGFAYGERILIEKCLAFLIGNSIFLTFC